MTDTTIPRPSATLVEARRTPGGTSVIRFEGAPAIRTTKSYQYLVIYLRSSTTYPYEVTHASVVKGTGSYKTAEAAVRKYSGYQGVRVVVITPSWTADADLAYKTILVG